MRQTINTLQPQSLNWYTISLFALSPLFQYRTHTIKSFTSFQIQVMIIRPIEFLFSCRNCDSINAELKPVNIHGIARFSLCLLLSPNNSYTIILINLRVLIRRLPPSTIHYWNDFIAFVQTTKKMRALTRQ